MHVTDILDKKAWVVQIERVENEDYKLITRKRFLFNWKKLEDECNIYKLTLISDKTSLGLIALADFPDEERIEIKLLSSAIENVGTKKRYDRIAGCLIAFAAAEAVRKYKNYPALSLIPKTELRQHYISKYGMLDTGWHLLLDEVKLFKVIEEYLK